MESISVSRRGIVQSLVLLRFAIPSWWHSKVPLGPSSQRDCLTPTMAISEMPTSESVYVQMSHRDLRKPNFSDSEHLGFGRYEDVYISPSR